MKKTHTPPPGYYTPDTAMERYETPKNLKHLLFSFTGRINRAQFWLGMGIVVPAIISALTFSVIIEHSAPIIIVYLCALWSKFAIWVKRCHDCNWSGAWTLLVLLPAINLIFLFGILGCVPGIKGPNSYGASTRPILTKEKVATTHREDENREHNVDPEHILGDKKNKENTVRFFYKYGLWLFLAAVILIGIVGSIYKNKQDEIERWDNSQPGREVLDSQRMNSAAVIFAYTDSTIQGLKSETDETTIGLTDVGAETLNAFYKDAEEIPRLNPGFGTYTYSAPRPLGFVPRIRAFMNTVQEESRTKYYVNSEGAEILMLYRAMHDMSYAELQKMSQYLAGWPAVRYNSTDCFYVYDKLLE